MSYMHKTFLTTQGNWLPRGYLLINGVAACKQNSDQFRIPSFSKRCNIAAGQLVELIFSVSKGQGVELEGLRKPSGDNLYGIRLWIEVKGIEEHGDFVGSLPRFLGGLNGNPGDLVRFRPQHIINVME